MKKILLASTALVLSAGLANAQAVSITGEGRMGLQYAGGSWSQENRLTLNFSVAVQADHGLSFGAFARLRTSGNTSAGLSGSRVWVEANGLRLTFGNQDGAIRGAGVAFGYAGGCGVGYEGGQQCGDAMGMLPVTQGFASTGAGVNRARVDYTMGNTRIAISNDASSTEIGVRHTAGAMTVAAGYSTGPFGVSFYTLSGAYNGGNWGAGAGVARDANGVTNYVLQASANMGGGRLYGYVGQVNSANAYGLSYGYGLGGGATLTVGAETVGATRTASVGVAFNF